MAKTRIAVTIETDVLERLDELVALEHFPNRSQAIESALAEKLQRSRRTRLGRECAKLDPGEEQALADQGLASAATQWPEY